MNCTSSEEPKTQIWSKLVRTSPKWYGSIGLVLIQLDKILILTESLYTRSYAKNKHVQNAKNHRV